jgi:hypothetical protein
LTASAPKTSTAVTGCPSIPDRRETPSNQFRDSYLQVRLPASQPLFIEAITEIPQTGGITEEMCARISKEDSCSMGGGRTLWPRVPAAPDSEFEDGRGLRLSCVEAALWVEERWQTVAGTAGATTCSCDAAGDYYNPFHYRDNYHHQHPRDSGEVLFHLIDLFCVSLCAQECVFCPLNNPDQHATSMMTPFTL